MTALTNIDTREVLSLKGVIYCAESDLELHMEISEVVESTRKLYEDPNMNAFCFKASGLKLYEVDDMKVNIKRGEHVVATEVYFDDGDAITLLTDTHQTAMTAVNMMADQMKRAK